VPDSRFTGVRELAIGGMAIIERAIMHGPHGFEKDVVLKRLRPELADQPALVDAFAAEARLGARVDHPNIAHVYELIDDHGRLAVVMELVRGWELRQLLDAARRTGTPFPFDAVATIASAVAAALHHVHELADDGRPLGFIHRDVSPSNVMVTAEGGVKLLDFGIAKAASSADHTQIGLVKGTTAYMSPEQCLQSRLDRRSDIFALGVSMYEMATLTQPFARAGDGDQTVMERIVRATCAPPTALAPDCAPELEAVILRALAPARELRFADALELEQAVEAVAAAHGVPLSPVRLARFAGDLMRREPPRLPVDDPDSTRIGTFEADTPGADVPDADADLDGDITEVD